MKEAANLLEELRIGGVNKSELAREGLKSVLREVASGEEKREVFARYRRGEIDEDVARVFLGDALDTMRADARETRDTMDRDTSELVR